MLQRRVTRYQSLSLVSSGIAIAGLIAAAIANLCFSRTAYLHVEEEDEAFLPAAMRAADAEVEYYSRLLLLAIPLTPPLAAAAYAVLLHRACRQK